VGNCDKKGGLKKKKKKSHQKKKTSYGAKTHTTRKLLKGTEAWGKKENDQRVKGDVGNFQY